MSRCVSLYQALANASATDRVLPERCDIGVRSGPSQSEVRRGHHRSMPLRGVVSIRHRARSAPFWASLVRTRRTLRQLPIMADKVSK